MTFALVRPRGSGCWEGKVDIPVVMRCYERCDLFLKMVLRVSVFDGSLLIDLSADAISIQALLKCRSWIPITLMILTQ